MDTIRGKGAEVRAAAAAPGVAGRVETEEVVEVLVVATDLESLVEVASEVVPVARVGAEVDGSVAGAEEEAAAEGMVAAAVAAVAAAGEARTERERKAAAMEVGKVARGQEMAVNE